MLVLSRKMEQVIVVTPPGCDPIRIKLVRIGGDFVKLGFEAKRDVEIYREEVWNQRQQVEAGLGEIDAKP